MTRRDRERREKVRSWAQETAQREQIQDFALPSTLSISTPPSEPTLVSLYDRVSGRNQEGNLKSRLQHFRKEVEALGHEVAGVYTDIGSGKELDRPGLTEALDAGLPVIAPCFSRFLRSAHYHAHFRPDARPSKEEIKRLIKKAGGTPLHTLADPDSTPSQDESFLRDLKGKGSAGYAKERKKRFREKAIALRREGRSFRDIARIVSRESGYPITAMGIWKWLNPR